MTFSVPTAVEALKNAPEVTRGLIGLVLARHDPGFDEDRQGAETRYAEQIRTGLAGVAAINDDRRRVSSARWPKAILRTNGAQPGSRRGASVQDRIAVVPSWRPCSVPWREIFVDSPRVEGIHLRAGPVARWAALVRSPRRFPHRAPGLMVRRSA